MDFKKVPFGNVIGPFGLLPQTNTPSQERVDQTASGMTMNRYENGDLETNNSMNTFEIKGGWEIFKAKLRNSGQGSQATIFNLPKAKKKNSLVAFRSVPVKT